MKPKKFRVWGELRSGQRDEFGREKWMWLRLTQPLHHSQAEFVAKQLTVNTRIEEDDDPDED